VDSRKCVSGFERYTEPVVVLFPLTDGI